MARNANVGTVKLFFCPEFFMYVRGDIICFACLETYQRKKNEGWLLPFFDVTFSRFIRSRSGSKCLLGLTGCLVLSTTILSIQSFFRKFFLCVLLLRQHNDFDRRKKVVERNELFFWSNLSSFFSPFVNLKTIIYNVELMFLKVSVANWFYFVNEQEKFQFHYHSV